MHPFLKGPDKNKRKMLRSILAFRMYVVCGSNKDFLCTPKLQFQIKLPKIEQKWDPQWSHQWGARFQVPIRVCSLTSGLNPGT